MASKTTRSGTIGPDPDDGSAQALMEEAAAILGPNGPIARCLPGFTVRPRQQEMADSVTRTLEAGGILISEAGTGTGKTLAYLVPALLHDGRVVISTGTKTLQDQLFHRDIPLVRASLASPARIAMLKGRSNYLCLHRFEETLRGAGFGNPHQVRQLNEVQAWQRRTDRGEISELTTIPEGDPIWYSLTSTADNCLGQQCSTYSDCHVVKARQRAQEAELLVINHHLLFSDILLRQEGFAELLPGSASFIIDEAHQLPAIASNQFGTAVSGRQLTELARDTQRALQAVGGDLPQVEQTAGELERQTELFRRALGTEQSQTAWRRAVADDGVTEAIDGLQQVLDGLDQQLEQIAGRDKSLENCRKRSQSLRARLRLFSEIPRAAAQPDGQARVLWVDSSRRSFILRETPMDYSDQFRSAMSGYDGAWIFTSATLAIGEDFSHFSTRLGIGDADTRRWESPFDYSSNALLYLPGDLPDPGDGSYTAAAVEAMRPVLEASSGRAFVLFTSHRALRQAAALFSSRPAPYPLLVQGTLPHSELLERFREAGNAVLLGTGSFWEGIDVRGPALSCVIIDKLPFAPPDDPVFQARAELIKAQGGNPFRDYQLPNAVVALKQGVGRLIRDADDRGVLMICDPRLLSRSYGRIFLANLPAMRRTRSPEDVEAFFAASDADALSAGGVR